MLVKSRSNVFFLLKNLSPNLSPSWMSLFRLWDLKFSVIWRQYSSQSLNGHLPTTDSKRTKEGVPALTSFPGCFPEKMGEAGNALIQYLYLTFYIGSHFSITDTKGVRDTRSWLQWSTSVEPPGYLQVWHISPLIIISVVVQNQYIALLYARRFLSFNNYPHP